MSSFLTCRVTRRGLLWSTSKNDSLLDVSFENPDDAAVAATGTWPPTCMNFKSLPGSVEVTAIDLWCAVNFRPLRDTKTKPFDHLLHLGCVWTHCGKICRAFASATGYDVRGLDLSYADDVVAKIAVEEDELIDFVKLLNLDPHDFTPQVLSLLFSAGAISGKLTSHDQPLLEFMDWFGNPASVNFSFTKEKNCVATAIANAGVPLGSSLKQLNQHTTVPWALFHDISASLAERNGMGLVLVDVKRKTYCNTLQKQFPLNLLIASSEGHADFAIVLLEHRLNKLKTAFTQVPFNTFANYLPLAADQYYAPPAAPKEGRKQRKAVRKEAVDQLAQQIEQNRVQATVKDLKFAANKEALIQARLKALEDKIGTLDGNKIRAEVARIDRALRSLNFVEDANGQLGPKDGFYASNFAAAEEMVSRGVDNVSSEPHLLEKVALIARAFQSNFQQPLPPRIGIDSCIKNLSASNVIRIPAGFTSGQFGLWGVMPLWDAHRGMFWFVAALLSDGTVDLSTLTLAAVVAPTVDMDEYSKAAAVLGARIVAEQTSNIGGTAVSILNAVVEVGLATTPGYGIKLGSMVKSCFPGNAAGPMIKQHVELKATTYDMDDSSILRTNRTEPLAPLNSGAPETTQNTLACLRQSESNFIEHYSSVLQTGTRAPTPEQQGFSNVGSNPITLIRNPNLIAGPVVFWRLADAFQNFFAAMRYGRFKLEGNVTIIGGGWSGTGNLGWAIDLVVVQKSGNTVFNAGSGSMMYSSAGTKSASTQVTMPLTVDNSIYAQVGYSTGTYPITNTSSYSFTEPVLGMEMRVRVTHPAGTSGFTWTDADLFAAFSIEWFEIPGDAQYMNVSYSGLQNVQMLAVNTVVQTELVLQPGTQQSVLDPVESELYKPEPLGEMRSALRMLRDGTTQQEVEDGSLFAASAWPILSVVKPLAEGAWKHVIKPLGRHIGKEIAKPAVRAALRKQAKAHLALAKEGLSGLQAARQLAQPNPSDFTKYAKATMSGLKHFNDLRELLCDDLDCLLYQPLSFVAKFAKDHSMELTYVKDGRDRVFVLQVQPDTTVPQIIGKIFRHDAVHLATTHSELGAAFSKLTISDIFDAQLFSELFGFDKSLLEQALESSKHYQRPSVRLSFKDRYTIEFFNDRHVQVRIKSPGIIEGSFQCDKECYDFAPPMNAVFRSSFGTVDALSCTSFATITGGNEIWFPAVREEGEIVQVTAIPIVDKRRCDTTYTPDFCQLFNCANIGVPPQAIPLTGDSCDLAFFMFCLKKVGYPVLVNGYTGVVSDVEISPQEGTRVIGFTLTAVGKVDEKCCVPGVLVAASALGVVHFSNSRQTSTPHPPVWSDFFCNTIAFTSTTLGTTVPSWRITIAM